MTDGTVQILKEYTYGPRSCIKTLLRDMKNAAVEDGATARWFISGTSPGQIHRGRVPKTVDNSNICVTLNMIIVVREYLDARGASPFAHWFDALDTLAAAKVAASLYRLEKGNFSRVKGVGGGVYECKIDFGPGYRVYFGKDGDELIILLGGGSKKRQDNDVAKALACWQDYKKRKR